MAQANPVLVEVTRGATVESRHRGAAVVVNSRGAAGSPRGETSTARVSPFIRQAAASIAAVGKRSGGAIRRLRPRTRARLRVAQRRAGPCRGGARMARSAGADGSGSRSAARTRRSIEAAAAALVRAGREPSPLHNNCSGKHLGFLTLGHAPRRAAERLRPSRPSGAAPGAARAVRDGRNGPLVGAGGRRRLRRAGRGHAARRHRSRDSRCLAAPTTCRARERRRGSPRRFGDDGASVLGRRHRPFRYAGDRRAATAPSWSKAAPRASAPPLFSSAAWASR